MQANKREGQLYYKIKHKDENQAEEAEQKVYVLHA